MPLNLADFSQYAVFLDLFIKGYQCISLCEEANCPVSCLLFFDYAVDERPIILSSEEDEIARAQSPTWLLPDCKEFSPPQKRRHTPAGYPHPQTRTIFQNVFEKP